MKRQLVVILIALAAGLAVGRYVLGGAASTGGSGSARSEVDEIAYAVSHILFDERRGRGIGEAEARARLAHKALLDGADFADVAKSRSDDPSARDGGFIGFVQTRGDSAFSGAVQALAPGQTSPVIRTQMGFQILKRHTFEEGRRLEERYWIPLNGFAVEWSGMPGGAGRTRAEARELAEEAKAKLAAGTLTLDQAARMYRGERPPQPEGFLGKFANRPGQERFYEAMKGKQPGAIVGPIPTERGWVVLVRARPLRSLVRHVLVQHALSPGRQQDVLRTPDEARARAREALAQVKADRSRWDEIVERYSDDPRTRARRGTMGILTHGEMPPGFEKVMFDLEAGEIADDAVESSLGYHVVWKVN